MRVVQRRMFGPGGERRRIAGVLAAGVLVAGVLGLSACADGDPEETGEPDISLPPTESIDNGNGQSNGGGDVLDLESMTDEELLAEVERSYRGLLDELNSVRASESMTYDDLDEWVTDHFRTVVRDMMEEYVPEGYEIRNTAELMWIQLSTEHVASESEVFANVCLDNTPIQVYDSAGVNVTSDETSQVSTATVRFVPSESATHLVIDWERGLEESESRTCSLD